MALLPFSRGIYLVADAGTVPDRERLTAIIGQALSGGVVAVQIRDKAGADRQTTELCRAALPLTRAAGVPLIINDKLDLVIETGADGLHIGQGDKPYAEARSLLGPKAIIGLSIERKDQALQAHMPGLDYVAASPVFTTPTKTDTAPALGLSGLQELAWSSRIPVVAIGGIQVSNIGMVATHGAYAAAVVSAICLATDPEGAAKSLNRAFFS